MLVKEIDTMNKISIKCDRCDKFFISCGRFLSQTYQTYCSNCSKEIKQMDKEAEELGYKCDECPNEYECVHANISLDANPSGIDVIKYILQQRILRSLHKKYGLEREKLYPILEEKIGADKEVWDWLLYAHIDKFRLSEMITFAENLEVEFEISIKYQKTDPTYLGSKPRKGKWSHEDLKRTTLK